MKSIPYGTLIIDQVWSLTKAIRTRNNSSAVIKTRVMVLEALDRTLGKATFRGFKEQYQLKR